METSNILPGIVSLFVLITLNAFFVLAEYSLAISRRTRIAELVDRSGYVSHSDSTSGCVRSSCRARKHYVRHVLRLRHL